MNLQEFIQQQEQNKATSISEFDRYIQAKTAEALGNIAEEIKNINKTLSDKILSDIVKNIT